MCGIAGIFGANKSVDAKQIVGEMNLAMTHRGPDAGSIYHNDNVTLGHRRLAIIDLSEEGVQPMYSKSGKTIMVFNGEIYNYQSIRKELNRTDWKGHSDSEVLVEAYEHWGNQVFEKLNGMFGVAFYNTENETLTIARDRLGIKPLYFADTDNGFVFASEIRPIVKSGLIGKKLDPKGLIEFLRFQTVYAPNTLLEDVQLLMPGSFMEISDSGSKMESFWQAEASIPSMDSKSIAEKKVRDLFMASVERRLVADVPFGAFLSGGIDSTAVVGAMTKVSSQPVSTYSIVFKEKEYSEATYSRLVAKKYNTQHHEIELSISDFKTQVEDALAAIDHPSGDGPNSYVVSKATKESGITMALSGLGGDELFAGYDIFKRVIALHQKAWLTAVPQFARELVGYGYAKLRPSVKADKIKQILSLPSLSPAYFYPISRLVNQDNILKRMLSKQAAETHLTPISPESTFNLSHLGLISKTSISEFKTYMQHVLLRDVDQMSMASSLEVRVPFLDHELVEYVLSLKDEVKYPTTPKQLLIDALPDLIPDEVIYRPKMGFVFPWEHWLRGELKPLVEDRMETLKHSNYFKPEELESLKKRFYNKDPRIPFVTIWTLVVLGDWMKRHNID